MSKTESQNESLKEKYLKLKAEYEAEEKRLHEAEIERENNERREKQAKIDREKARVYTAVVYNNQIKPNFDRLSQAFGEKPDTNTLLYIIACLLITEKNQTVLNEFWGFLGIAQAVENDPTIIEGKG